jgi:hypothetical protein
VAWRSGSIPCEQEGTDEGFERLPRYLREGAGVFHRPEACLIADVEGPVDAE